MPDTSEMKWIRGGTLVSSLLAIGFAFLLRWKTARLFMAFAIAFGQKWQQSRLTKDVETLLKKIGGDV